MTLTRIPNSWPLADDQGLSHLVIEGTPLRAGAATAATLAAMCGREIIVLRRLLPRVESCEPCVDNYFGLIADALRGELSTGDGRGRAPGSAE